MAEATTLSLVSLKNAQVADILQAALAPQKMVTIDCSGAERLPASTIAVVLALSQKYHGFIRFEGLNHLAAVAVAVLDPDRHIGVSTAARTTPPVGDRPYTVTVNSEGSLAISLQKGIGQNPHMNESISYEWIRGLEVKSVTIDLAHIDHLNSLLVAWLLQFNQGAGPNRCTLINVGRQAVTQLTQLRLNHLLVIA
jgi:ABC-type transporter Mla MlaB component